MCVCVCVCVHYMKIFRHRWMYRRRKKESMPALYFVCIYMCACRDSATVAAVPQRWQRRVPASSFWQT